jgi:hypothetical protein
MNMIGHPKHVKKCLEIGADLICAQGGEGGGHTGDVPTTILIPTVAALCRGKKSPLTGQDVQVIAAGGLFNGQSLAAALMLGASAVWVGTRFVLSEEAGAPKAHQEAVRTAGFDDNIRTIIFTVCLHRIIFHVRKKHANLMRRDVLSVSATTLILPIGKRTAHRRSRSSQAGARSQSSTTWRLWETILMTTLLTTPDHSLWARPLLSQTTSSQPRRLLMTWLATQSSGWRPETAWLSASQNIRKLCDGRALIDCFSHLGTAWDLNFFCTNGKIEIMSFPCADFPTLC